MVLCWFSSNPLLCLALGLRGWFLWTVSAASLGPWILVGFMQWGAPAEEMGREDSEVSIFIPLASSLQDHPGWMLTSSAFHNLILLCQIMATIPPLALLGLEVQVVLLLLDLGYCITLCRVSLPTFELPPCQFFKSKLGFPDRIWLTQVPT